MLCSALRRAAVGWESFANVSCERIASFWPRNRVLARIGLFGRVSETRDLAFCRQGPSQGLPNPTFSCQSAVSCPFSDDFSARSPPNRWRAENPPEKARASCARIPKGRGSCVRIPQERGLTMAETLALGGEGASELPFCQRGRRRIGKARRADLARPCPFELRFAALRGSPGRGNWGHPPPSTDPDPMGSSGGGDRYQVALRRDADRPSRTALFPCPRRRSGCVAGGRAFPGRAGPPSRRMRGKSAARSRFPSQAACTFPIAVVRTRHGPSPSGAPFSPPLAASPLLLARLFSLRTLSNPRFFLRMIDSGANGFNLCACTNRAKRRHETSCPMAG